MRYREGLDLVLKSISCSIKGGEKVTPNYQYGREKVTPNYQYGREKITHNYNCGREKAAPNYCYLRERTTPNYCYGSVFLDCMPCVLSDYPEFHYNAGILSSLILYSSCAPEVSF